MPKCRELPDVVIISGIPYTIEYKENPSDVDIHRRDSMWGQIDYWTKTIRIYNNGNPPQDVWSSIFHEVLHGIAEAFNIDSLRGEGSHEDLDLLALALYDTFSRNGWLAE